MSNRKVFFLDREYDISEYLPELIEEYKQINAYASPLFDVLKEQMKNETYASDEDSDFKVWKDAAKKVASKYIDKAAKKGVHDLSMWELVDSNKSIQPTGLFTTCHLTHHHITMNLLNAMNDWFDQYEAAYDKVGSNVNGPGFGILTNSLASVLLYEVISYGAEKKQFERDNEEFKRYIGSLNNSTNNRIDKNRAQYLAMYYTYIREDIPEVVQDMLYVYLKKLENYNLFDTMLYWDYPLDSIDKSNQILERYNTARNDEKKNLLCDAFEQCPFNPEIFNNAVKDEFIDRQTIDTAKYLHQADGIKNLLREQLLLAIRFNEIDKIENIISLINYIDDCSMEETMASELKPITDDLTDKYLKLQTIIKSNSNDKYLITWVKKNLTENVNEFVEIEDTKIDKKTMKIIDNICANEFFTYLFEHGFVDIKKIALDENDIEFSIDSLKEKYIAQLTLRIKELRNILKEKKQNYCTAKANCTSEKQKLQNEVDELIRARDSLSIFKRKAKNDINTQIKEIYIKMDSLEEKYELEFLQKEYNW